ncbi:hypothetical protein H8I69_06020 [Serratia fonticola]|uniref:hypothetical protein n=1 Tax=Serratia fonticola TaxID=47917 RepID=UPI0015C5BFB3|nr:hypothetical protein [Serratia fonticola]MBC3378674.1 hypothetical protein [Serratia fonticola]NYA37874.1 hypothetical protein [Serratia fonticola]
MSKKSLYILIGFLIIPYHVSAIQSSAEKSIPLSAIFVAPPCNVSIDNGNETKIIELGDITFGEKSHPPFTLSVDCKYSRGSSVYAEVVQGSLSQGGKNKINMQDAQTGTETPVQIFLREGSQPEGIEYDTSSGSDPDVQFCKGDSTRVCTLTPVTSVRADAGVRAGLQLITSVRFTIVNP